eukprot:15091738-Alexandrium_andersonii.AAC.1
MAQHRSTGPTLSSAPLRGLHSVPVQHKPNHSALCLEHRRRPHLGDGWALHFGARRSGDLSC